MKNKIRAYMLTFMMLYLDVGLSCSGGKSGKTYTFLSRFVCNKSTAFIRDIITA